MNQKSSPKKVTRGLFPTSLPIREWVTFEAEGFATPVCGVIYRLATPASNGMPLGSLDTGCIDLETSGMLGYCSIFNTHTPRRGPLNLPFLGLSTGGTTWVLCDPSQIKRYEPPHLERDRTTYPPLPEGFPISVQDFKLDSVRTVKEIHYWGHYPVADLEYEIDAPLDIGLRAWAPFLPGDIERSLLPGIVFEVHVRNNKSALQLGTLAFSFPGPTVEEAGGQHFNRSRVSAQFNGVVVEGAMASFALGVDSAMQLRVGGELGVNGEAWSRIADELPEVVEDQPGTSVALDFTLTPGEETVVRFVLTWYSPQWRGGGYPASLEGNTFTHMYAKYYPNPVQTAAILIREHKSLLKRVLAWQEAIFTEEILPGWMQDSLINVLHLIAEGSLWAQNEPPLPDWVRPEDGLFGMIESPRDCPDIAVVCCTYWDQIPVVYFFPQLALSTLRGFKNYQDSEGAPPFMFGGYAQHTPPLEFTSPRRGYQVTTNLPSYIAMAHRYWLVTGDGDFLEEFYPSLKRSALMMVDLNRGPDGIISMPDRKVSEGPMEWESEWFEWYEWYGMATHVGGLHLAALQMVRGMAERVGDDAFVRQCDVWLESGKQSLEDKLWNGTHYLHFWDRETGKKSEAVMANQLDGQWMSISQGFSGIFRSERVKIVLQTIKRINTQLTAYGAVDFAHSDGTMLELGEPPLRGPYHPSQFSTFELFMLSATYMYAGQVTFGLELCRRLMHNIVCRQGYTWDFPAHIFGDTGERAFGSDYTFNLIFWLFPAAVTGKDLSGSLKQEGLVGRILSRGAANNKFKN